MAAPSVSLRLGGHELIVDNQWRRYCSLFTPWLSILSHDIHNIRPTILKEKSAADNSLFPQAATYLICQLWQWHWRCCTLYILTHYVSSGAWRGVCCIFNATFRENSISYLPCNAERTVFRKYLPCSRDKENIYLNAFSLLILL